VLVVMDRVDRGRAAQADTGASEGSDLLLLRQQLTLNGGNIETYSTRVGESYATYRQGLGRHPKPVVGEIVLLRGAIENMLSVVRGLQMTTAAGANAQRLVVSTLTALDSGLSDLHQAYSADKTRAAKVAVARAKASAKRSEQLRLQASQALGYSWQL
jgi:hypothetical protein